MLKGTPQLRKHPVFVIQDRVINTRNYKKHICGLQSIIDKCRICGAEGETIEHIISFCTALTQANIRNVMIYSLKLYA
jgi:hypothetical protein